MQIPRVGFLSLLSFVSLVSSSFGSLRPIHCEKSSDSPDQVSFQGHEYALFPTDIYHIHNTELKNDVTYDENVHGTEVFLEPRIDRETQSWLIAETVNNEYTIFNLRTRAYLTAIGAGETVQANQRSPTDLHVRWRFHSKVGSRATHGPFQIESVAFPKTYLGAFSDASGEFVVTDQLKAGRHQVWDLQN